MSLSVLQATDLTEAEATAAPAAIDIVVDEVIAKMTEVIGMDALIAVDPIGEPSFCSGVGSPNKNSMETHADGIKMSQMFATKWNHES